MLVRRSEISDTLRISGRKSSGALGLGRIDPDAVDLLLGFLGDVADHLHGSLPAAREQRAGFAEVEAGDVGLLVVGPGWDAKQFCRGVVAGERAHPRGVLAR